MIVVTKVVQNILLQWLGGRRFTGFFYSLTVVLFTSFAPVQALSQDYSALFRNFDTRDLTHDDRRFLQAALAFEGHYKGLLDGDWGPRSQKALRDFSWSEFGTPSEEWHSALLAFSLFDKVSRDGWEIQGFENLGTSFLVPTKALAVDSNTKFFVNWRHTQSSLSFSLGAHVLSQTKSLHEYAWKWHGLPSRPYSVRRDGFAVTRAIRANGSVLYVRSDYLNGKWATLMLSADAKDEKLLDAVASSITVGASRPLQLTPGGKLDKAIRQVLEILEKEERGASQNAETTKRSTPEKKRGGSGTGFFVSKEGHVLTNSHVVEDCTSVLVDGTRAAVVNRSDSFDLALVKAAYNSGQAVAEFSPEPARLNSDVTVIGYPLVGLLGGLNVTRGAVSSTKGLLGSEIHMQITAPIQPGNSGGPVVGPDGEIVGVVVAQIDAMKVEDAIGSIPQNVNFAIRGEIAKLFLSQNGITPKLGQSDERVESVGLAEKASKYTVFIQCK